MGLRFVMSEGVFGCLLVWCGEKLDKVGWVL